MYLQKKYTHTQMEIKMQRTKSFYTAVPMNLTQRTPFVAIDTFLLCKYSYKHRIWRVLLS